MVFSLNQPHWAESVVLWFCAIGCSFFQGLSLALKSHNQFQAFHWSPLPQSKFFLDPLQRKYSPPLAPLHFFHIFSSCKKKPPHHLFFHLIFLHPPIKFFLLLMAMVILSASVERFSVCRMRYLLLTVCSCLTRLHFTFNQFVLPGTLYITVCSARHIQGLTQICLSNWGLLHSGI